MSRRNLAHREVSNIGKFEGVFFGAAKLLYDNADRVDENRRSHPLLVAVENGDQTEVVNQLSGISGTAKMEELFEYVTDFVSICCCLDTMVARYLRVIPFLYFLLLRSNSHTLAQT